jgi:hypothetical protein
MDACGLDGFGEGYAKPQHCFHRWARARRRIQSRLNAFTTRSAHHARRQLEGIQPAVGQMNRSAISEDEHSSGHLAQRRHPVGDPVGAAGLDGRPLHLPPSAPTAAPSFPLAASHRGSLIKVLSGQQFCHIVMSGSGRALKVTLSLVAMRVRDGGSRKWRRSRARPQTGCRWARSGCPWQCQSLGRTAGFRSR